MTHQTLKTLETAERAAWRAKMKGADVDTCTEFGRVGKLEQEWRDAADACRAYREANGLLGLTWRQIERVAA